MEPDVVNKGAIAAAGAHTHTTDGGGDAETRPINVAINWIIKI